MPDMSAIAAGTAALKSAFEISNFLVKQRDKGLVSEKAAELQGIILELQRYMFEMQAQQSAAQREIDDLRKQISGFDRWIEVQADYQMRDFGDQAFALEYVGSDSAKPPHKACPHCFGQREIRTLQFRGTSVLQQKIFQCVSCNKEFYLGPLTSYVPPKRDSDWGV